MFIIPTLLRTCSAVILAIKIDKAIVKRTMKQLLLQ